MTMMIPNASEATLLGYALGVATPGNQVLHLFTNNVVPASADLTATYTEMATLGYASKSLTKTSWSPVAGTGIASASYAAQTWTFTAGTAVTVYGYFITDSTSGLLLWAEAFSTPKVVQYTGDQITITPVMTLNHV